MEDALVEYKHNIKKKKSLNKRAVVEDEVSSQEIVPMEKSERTNSENESDSDFDGFSDDETDKDIKRMVTTIKAMAKGGVSVLPKKEKPKEVMIKKKVSTCKEKRKREEVQTSKGPSLISKNPRTSKSPGV